jgi:membrane protein required for colicin V production
MVIDTLFAILMVMAIFKGLKNGVVVAVFSFIAIFIGLAAAIKCSALVAGWLSNSTSVDSRWLPILSFIIIMVGVMLLVRLGAKLIEKTLTVTMLGWANRLGGVLLYAVLYTTILSVLLFYAKQIGILKEEALSKSIVYPYIQNWGPKGIEIFASVLPFLKNSFAELEQFFGSVAEKAKT